MYTFSTKAIITLLLFVLFLQPTSVLSDIINVPDDFETIQAAIDTSEAGDTVLVQPGEYVENINFDGKAITVASLILTTGDEAYIDSTIIDGDRRSSVVRFDSEEDETSILTGFSITNGTGSDDIDRDNGGGGIMCIWSSPTLRYLKVFGNRANYGGGIMIQLSSPLIEFVSVYSDTAYNSGGGIYCSRQGCEPTISHSRIFRNYSIAWGGGIGCCYGVSPVLDHVTIAYNRVRDGWSGSGIYVEGHFRIRNTILWGNGVYMVGDLTVSYSDVSGGEDGIRVGNGDLNWGEGNIDDNPLFVDPDEDDFHLQEDSPCIDAGDPDSQVDTDGTRTDMGAYPFFQGYLVIEGCVLDAENNQPLDSARVSASFGVTTFTDTSGFWRISPARMFPFEISASFGGYLDSTIQEIQLELDDTLEVTFGLLHTEFIPSEEEFTSVLDSGDSTSFDFSISNTGNGTLNWEVSKRLVDVPDPWELRRSYSVSDSVADPRIEGVIFADNRFYVSGSNIEGDERMIYVLDRDGHEINRFPQFGEEHYGMRDLAWDGELIWGCDENMVIGFNTEGDSITAFEGPDNRLNSIAWDPDREVLWVAPKTGDGIYAVKRDGSEVDSLQLPRFGLKIYGLAYYPEEHDGYKLFIFHNPDNNSEIVYKINPVTQDTTFVKTLIHELGGKAQGAFISNSYDPRSWVFASIANNAADDRIDIYQIDANTSWISLNPTGGEIEAQASQDLTLSIFTEGLLVPDWEAELVFNHNSAGGETILPVTLTIRPDAVEERDNLPIPDEFSISNIHPNPFNSAVTVNYNLLASSKASLKLFNITGREVITVFNEWKTAGTHTVIIDNSGLSAGLYLIRLESGNDVAVRKVVLVK
ncbi:MAG: T9SS type A sorting domain-containing protein [Calditrichaeota bacterium]|nr:T9SS type A sorting domain-containing protein [Calditrichota bacterium]